MNYILPIALIGFMVSPGCANTKTATQATTLPLRYHNARYSLTIYLPASWQGYSVSIEQLEDTTYSPAQDKQIVVGHTPMISLRHPLWKETEHWQDIPILVFTRRQWDALNRGKLWPPFAGGTIDELWHNQSFVFAMSSRYNADDNVSGWSEAAHIIELNRAANQVQRLYQE